MRKLTIVSVLLGIVDLRVVAVALGLTLLICLSGCGGALEALGAVGAAMQGVNDANAPAPQRYYVVVPQRPAFTTTTCSQNGRSITCDQW